MIALISIIWLFLGCYYVEILDLEYPKNKKQLFVQFLIKGPIYICFFGIIYLVFVIEYSVSYIYNSLKDIFIIIYNRAKNINLNINQKIKTFYENN